MTDLRSPGFVGSLLRRCRCVGVVFPESNPPPSSASSALNACCHARKDLDRMLELVLPGISLFLLLLLGSKPQCRNSYCCDVVWRALCEFKAWLPLAGHDLGSADQDT